MGKIVVDEGLKCPVCNSQMAADDSSCSACPMGKSCNFICCINCGYKDIDTEKYKDKWKKILKRG